MARFLSKRPTPSRRHWAFAVVVLLGALASGSAWSRLGRVTEESNPTLFWRQQGAAAYRKMPSVPLEDAESVRQAIGQAFVEDPQNLLAGNDAALSSLRSACADFLIERFNAGSSDGYIASMESRGYHFKSREEFERSQGSLAWIERIADVSSEEPRAIFRKLWDHPPSRRATPDAICVDRNAMVISIGESNRNRVFTETLAGTLGREIWHGGSSAKCRMWMSPPVDRDTLIRKHGEILAAQVGVIVNVPGSQRRPLIVCLFQDPSDLQWWVDEINVTNFLGTDEIWTCGEY